MVGRVGRGQLDGRRDEAVRRDGQEDGDDDPPRPLGLDGAGEEDAGDADQLAAGEEGLGAGPGDLVQRVGGGRTAGDGHHQEGPAGGGQGGGEQRCVEEGDEGGAAAELLAGPLGGEGQVEQEDCGRGEKHQVPNLQVFNFSMLALVRTVL